MKRGGYRSRVVSEPNKWFGSEDVGAWEYGNYKRCYLTIRKDDLGKYVPCVNGGHNVDFLEHSLPNCGYFQFDTFEQAAQHLYNYVDWLREYRDVESRRVLHAALHRSNPTVYPA